MYSTNKDSIHFDDLRICHTVALKHEKLKSTCAEWFLALLTQLHFMVLCEADIETLKLR